MNLHRYQHMGYIRIMGALLLTFIVVLLGMAEWVMVFVLHYILFFLCYGAARFLCQKWMWQLHFWPVFMLLCLIVLLSAVFVFLIAPMIPLFAAAMAMPPYVDPSNAEMIHEVLKDHVDVGKKA